MLYPQVGGYSKPTISYWTPKHQLKYAQRARNDVCPSELMTRWHIGADHIIGSRYAYIS